jgi:hypothetical protein
LRAERTERGNQEATLEPRNEIRQEWHRAGHREGQKRREAMPERPGFLFWPLLMFERALARTDAEIVPDTVWGQTIVDRLRL